MIKLKANRWKKLLLFLLIIVLLSQLPFAYRRYRLGRLQAAIQKVNSERIVAADNLGFREYKGVAHVHSSLGGHSTGTFEEIIAAAQANQLNFVLMTEHPSKNFDTAAMTLEGLHGGVLFVNGNEVSTANGDRLLLFPGDWRAALSDSRSTQEILDNRDDTRHTDDRLEFVAYPREFKSWELSGYAGIEVYNVYTNARRINPLVMFFDALWSYRAYPDLLFANFYRRPDENLRLWDEQIKRKGERLVATAGNDAHANVGISLNDSTGKTLLGTKLDPYERSFRLVRLHVIVSTEPNAYPMSGPRPLDEWELLTSISAGHCFIAFDLFGDTTGFRYTAHDGDENRMMGDEIKLDGEVSLNVSLPVPARVVLLKDGNVVRDDAGSRTRDYKVNERGSYRVEVYLPQLPGTAGAQPWIISNPIYVR